MDQIAADLQERKVKRGNIQQLKAFRAELMAEGGMMLVSANIERLVLGCIEADVWK